MQKVHVNAHTCHAKETKAIPLFTWGKCRKRASKPFLEKRLMALQVDEERPQIFLQAHCTLNIGASLFVVKLAVVYHKHEVSVQHLLGLVVISLTNSFFDSRQIDRFLDYLKVVL